MKKTAQKGYTLLFAVIVAVLVLSVATFIVSVARKQFLLSSAARDSLYAFYSADSGIECAMNNYYLFSTSSAPSTISCGLTKGASTIGVWPTTFRTDGSSAGTTTFSMYTGANDAGNAGSCAFVTVEEYTVASNLVVSIKSRGYNIGWNTGVTPSDCSLPGPRKVERAIQVLYQ